MRHNQHLAKTRECLVVPELFVSVVILRRMARDFEEDERVDDGKRVIRRALGWAANDGGVRGRWRGTIYTQTSGRLDRTADFGVFIEGIEEPAPSLRP